MNKVFSIYRDLLFYNIILVLLICSIFYSCKDKPGRTTVIKPVNLDSIKYSNPETKPDSIVIISDFQNYQNVYDLINYRELKGNVLYLDIWATYCGPCLKEFQISKELKDRYKGKPIKFIYLVDVRDDPRDLTRWDSLIHKYKLYGYHLRMSNRFYNNINTIPDIKFTGKPHYILIDKEGKIVFPNANRPSSKIRLYEQIDGLL